jgi:hypothetical protein
MGSYFCFPRFDPDDIRKFKSVPTGNKKFSADYDWNEQVLHLALECWS